MAKRKIRDTTPRYRGLVVARDGNIYKLIWNPLAGKIIGYSDKDGRPHYLYKDGRSFLPVVMVRKAIP